MLYGRLPTTRSAAPSVAKVERQRVGDVQRQAFGREVRASRAARSRSISIAVRCPARSISGAVSAARPGPDLDQVVARRGRDRGDDARDVVRIDEEILAEALAGLVTVHVSSVPGYAGAA